MEESRQPRFRAVPRYGLWYLVDSVSGTVVGRGLRRHSAARALAARLNSDPIDLAAWRTLRDPRFRRGAGSY